MGTQDGSNAPVEHLDKFGFGTPARDIHEAGLRELNQPMDGYENVSEEERQRLIRSATYGKDDNFGFTKPADPLYREPEVITGRERQIQAETLKNFAADIRRKRWTDESTSESIANLAEALAQKFLIAGNGG